MSPVHNQGNFDMARNPFRGIVNFVRRVRHMPPPPDPSRGYNPDRSQMREATRASFPGRSAAGGPRRTDKIIGKTISDSHKLGNG